MKTKQQIEYWTENCCNCFIIWYPVKTVFRVPLYM